MVLSAQKKKKQLKRRLIIGGVVAAGILGGAGFYGFHEINALKKDITQTRQQLQIERNARMIPTNLSNSIENDSTVEVKYVVSNNMSNISILKNKIQMLQDSLSSVNERIQRLEDKLGIKTSSNKKRIVKVEKKVEKVEAKTDQALALADSSLRALAHMDKKYERKIGELMNKQKNNYYNDLIYYTKISIQEYNKKRRRGFFGLGGEPKLKVSEDEIKVAIIRYAADNHKDIEKVTPNEIVNYLLSQK